MSKIDRMIVEDAISSRHAGLSAEQQALLKQRLRAGLRGMAEKPGIPHRNRETDAPLSFAQQRIWFLDQLDPGSPLYNISVGVRIRGRLEQGALQRAIDVIVARHESLRTRHVMVDGNAVQCVDLPQPVTMKVVEVGTGEPGQAEAAVRRLLKEEARRPFDLSLDPMLRALLIRLSDTEHVLSFTAHHIAADGWSLGVFFRELAVGYEAFVAGREPLLPVLPIQYGDFAVWQREWLQGETQKRQLDYWKRQLAGANDLLELATDRPRPVKESYQGACEALTLSPELSAQLKALGRREGVTLFMLLLAAFQVLIHRYTRQKDILVGTPVAGRNQMETEGLIGLFINTLVMRADFSGQPTFREWLHQVRQMTIDALAHQDLPFERLVEELRIERNLNRNPLFQVMFALQNAPMRPENFAGLTVEPMDVNTETAKFDLTMAVEDCGRDLLVNIEYNTAIYSAETIHRMLGHFRMLLEGIVANPGERISGLRLLNEEETQWLHNAGQGPATDYPRHLTIPQLFAEQVAANPDAVAVTFEGRSLTYRQLDVRANQLAHYLQKAGAGPDVAIGVCLERSLELIVALVGILKSGSAYISLDPAYPQERLRWMLEDARPPVLLTQDKLRPAIESEAAGQRVICLDTGWREIADEPEEEPIAASTAEHLAYISFTSGSTGRPKGVCVPHRGVARLVKGNHFAQLDAKEVLLQLSPVAFDASTLEIWGALLNGGQLVVYPPQTPQLAELGEFIQTHGITTLWLTAGLFHAMVDEQLDNLRGVRQLLAGGDVLSVPHVQRALAALPGCRLVNGYGPTENTTFTCCHQPVAPLPDRQSIPIGRPIANTCIRVMDEHGHLVPVGVPGELHVGGDGLARGYLNRPELTAEKFVPDPLGQGPEARLYRTGDLVRWRPDGTVEFLGRLDAQVKIRGFRVEPGEVEAALAAHPTIKECAVVARETVPGGKQLVAYLVSREKTEPGAAELRDHLRLTLPDYMLPSAFMFLEQLPVSPNGKVNRAALPDVEQNRVTACVAPKNSTELQLLQIWEEVLGVRPIGVTDAFFELGGHSLLAVRLATRMEKLFNRRLPVATIFKSPTIRQLAEILNEQLPVPPGSSIVEIQPKGSRPPLFFVHGVGGGMFWGYTNLAHHLGPDQPVYAIKSRGLDGLAEHNTIEEMAATYVADLREFQPKGPYYLGGYCFGGNVAYEMARQLTALGHQPVFLALLNCAPPNSSYTQVRWNFTFLRKFIGNMACWAADFLHWDGRKQREFVRWQLRTLRSKVGRLLAASTGTTAPLCLDEVVDVSAYPDAQRKLWATHLQALFKYQPSKYRGRVTLYRSRAHPLLCSFDRECGWGELADEGVGVIIVPGAHESILEEPHVKQVACELARTLQTVQP